VDPASNAAPAAAAIRYFFILNVSSSLLVAYWSLRDR
jgi:hypothetical protein